MPDSDIHPRFSGELHPVGMKNAHNFICNQAVHGVLIAPEPAPRTKKLLTNSQRDPAIRRIIQASFTRTIIEFATRRGFSCHIAGPDESFILELPTVPARHAPGRTAMKQHGNR